MDPYTIAMLAITAAGAASQAFKKGPQTQYAATPSGGTPAGNAGPIGELLAGVSGGGQKVAPPVNFETPKSAPAVGNPPTSDLAGDEKKKKGGETDSQVGEILAALPEAIALASDLLGFNDAQDRRPAPTAGNAQGGLIPAFNLPQPSGLGTLLSSIPRLR